MTTHHPVTAGEAMILVSAMQLKMPIPVDPHEPIIQKCYVRQTIVHSMGPTKSDMTA
jgi:hypothetical protein